MPRTDIFKRIKNDKVIQSRIQKYRLHYDYLKTCLDFPNDFKVDKSKYIHWKLNLVSKHSFNQWWTKVGSDLFNKEIEQVKEVRTARQSNTSTKMIHRNYLDEDDVMMIEEYQKMYSKK